MGPCLGTRVPIGTFFWHFGSLLGLYLYFWVPIFSVLASFTRRMSIQSALHVYNNEFSWYVLWVMTCTFILHMLWSDAPPVGHYRPIWCGHNSVVFCWHYCRILIFTYAHTLNGSLFQKKLGPYLEAWGSLLVLETVPWMEEWFLFCTCMRPWPKQLHRTYWHMWNKELSKL